MQRLGWFLVLGCLSAGFSQTSFAQYERDVTNPSILNPYNPNNMWQQNINSTVQDRLARKILLNSINKKRIARGEKPLETDADYRLKPEGKTAPQKTAPNTTTQHIAAQNIAAQTQHQNTEQAAQAPYVKARHQYRPTASSAFVDEYVKTLNLNGDQEAELKASLNKAMRMIYAETKKRNRHGNISFAVAVLVGTAYSIFYGETFEDTKLEAISKAYDQVLGRLPQLDTLSNADKQKMAEGCLLIASLFFEFHQQALQAKDFKTLEGLKLAMRQLVQPWGLDEHTLKPMLEHMLN